MWTFGSKQLVTILSSVVVALMHVCTSCHQVLLCSATNIMNKRKVKEHPQFPGLKRLQEN